MEGPPIISISTVTEAPKHLLQQMMDYHCVTWHPYFEKKYYDRIMNVVHTQVPYENITNDNKWGYQYHISSDLEKIPVDYTDTISVKNKIVMDNFTVSINDNNEHYYSTRNAVSIYEIFYRYCSVYKKDIDEWDHDNLKELRELHAAKKKKYSQYTFFKINEKELGYFVNAILHLKNS